MPRLGLSVPGIATIARPHGSSYTGPLDIVGGAVVAYSQRALSAAKRGSALYTIRRDSDDTTHTYNSDATTGDAPAASISSFIGAANGFVAAWTDQSGNGNDVSQATNANQPGWDAAALNSKPGISFVAANSNVLTTPGSATWPSSSFTFFFVAKSSVDGGIHYIAGANVDGSGPDIYIQIGSSSAASSGSLTFGADDAGFADDGGGSFSSADVETGQFYLFELLWDASAGSPTALLNGAQLTRTADFTSGDTGVIAEQFNIGAEDLLGTATAFFDGVATEFLGWPSYLSGANRLATRQNIAAYYGITLS
jgi:hypothetical protein